MPYVVEVVCHWCMTVAVRVLDGPNALVLYCSPECGQAARRAARLRRLTSGAAPASEPADVEVTCRRCGETVTRPGGGTPVEYCSRRCAHGAAEQRRRAHRRAREAADPLAAARDGDRCVPTGRRIHDTREAAELFAQTGPRHLTSSWARYPYPCPRCGLWHLRRLPGYGE